MALVVQVSVVQVVGQDADRAGGAARRLAEEGAGSGAGSDHWWWRDLAAAALGKHPEETGQPIRARLQDYPLHSGLNCSVLWTRVAPPPSPSAGAAANLGLESV